MNVRIIDADALKEQVESHVVSMSVCLSMDEHYGKVTMREDCLQDIADAPTIEAIPLEWLNNKMLDLQNRDKALSRAAWLVLYEWQKGQGAR
jgi:hypothetical protein